MEYKVTGECSEGATEYGIALYRHGRLQMHLPNLSESRADMDALASILNELRVDACHFADVVEDYLTDFSVD